MAKRSTTASKRGEPKRASGTMARAAAIVIVAAIVAVAAYLIYGYLRGSGIQQSASFSTFESNFNSANRVAIIATAQNGTAMSSTVGCATAVIIQIVSNPNHHRNPATIDYYVVNQTSCIFSQGGLGQPTSNYSVVPLQRCLNTTRTEPTIYINYTSANSTIIRPDYLYTGGTADYLAHCGIANEFG